MYFLTLKLKLYIFYMKEYVEIIIAKDLKFQNVVERRTNETSKKQIKSHIVNSAKFTINLPLLCRNDLDHRK